MLKNQKKSPLNEFGKYSALAFQMGLIMFAGAFGGKKLDEVVQNTFPWFTLLGTLAGLGLSLYQVFRDLLR